MVVVVVVVVVVVEVVYASSSCVDSHSFLEFSDSIGTFSNLVHVQPPLRCYPHQDSRSPSLTLGSIPSQSLVAHTRIPSPEFMKDILFWGRVTVGLVLHWTVVLKLKERRVEKEYRNQSPGNHFKLQMQICTSKNYSRSYFAGQSL